MSTFEFTLADSFSTLSLHLSITPSLYLYLSFSLSLFLSITLSLYLYLSFSLSLYLSFSLSPLSLHLFISPSLYLTIYLHLSIYQSLYLSISPSLHPFISLTLYLTISPKTGKIKPVYIDDTSFIDLEATTTIASMVERQHLVGLLTNLGFKSCI